MHYIWLSQDSYKDVYAKEIFCSSRILASWICLEKFWLLGFVRWNWFPKLSSVERGLVLGWVTDLGLNCDILLWFSSSTIDQAVVNRNEILLNLSCNSEQTGMQLKQMRFDYIISHSFIHFSNFFATQQKGWMLFIIMIICLFNEIFRHFSE